MIIKNEFPKFVIQKSKMMELVTPVMIYAESTPNPATLKFVLNRTLLPEYSVEYSNDSDTSSAPLVNALFTLPYVKGVYITNNFITITKQPTFEWIEVMGELREFIKKFMDDGNPVFAVLPEKPLNEKSEVDANQLSGGEIEQKIMDILDEYIKPAVEQDGGEIAFKSFESGVVSVQLKGSCSGCPSSTLTLKAGIEQLLKRMVPGVESVVAENA